MKRSISVVIALTVVVAFIWPQMPWSAFAIQARTLTVSQMPGTADFTSIQAALDAASAGDTVEIIDSAVYTENLLIRASKTGVTLRAREGQTPAVKGTAARVITISGASDVTLRGLKVTGGAGGGVLTTGAAVKNLTVQSCRFEAIPIDGIALGPEETAQIKNCTFVNLGGPGINMGPGASAVISGNEFRGGPMNGDFSDGIELQASSADIIGNTFIALGRFGIGTFTQSQGAPVRSSTVRIINNLIAGSGSKVSEFGDGMQLVGSANTVNMFTLVNNTIVNSARLGINFILVDRASRVTLSNTIVTNSKSRFGDLGEGGVGTGQAAQITIRNSLIGKDAAFNSIGRNGNITGDPTFVDPGNSNYRLQQSSTAIDAGDNNAISGFTTDLDGNPRILAGHAGETATVDIGSYEFNGISCSLDPATAINQVGSSHTVKLTVTDRGNPVSGVPVSFTVTNGPNSGMSGSGMTDNVGQASFVYTSNGMPGADMVQASGSVRSFQFICIAAVTWMPRSAPIQFGQTITGSIDAPGKTDRYTFQAATGDVIRVRMSRASGTLNPKIELLDSLGILIQPKTGTDDATLDITIVAGGTFFVTAADDNGRDTGGYGLSLQRLSNPVGAMPLALGQNVTATIGTAAKLDAYSFTASSGEVLRVRMSRSSGTLNPLVELFDVNGMRSARITNSTDAILDSTISSTGTYLLIVSDDNGRDTGGYGLSLQRLNNPVGATPLNFGQVTTGSINAAAKLNAYAFNGMAGSMIKIRMLRTSGTINPLIELFDPAGMRIQRMSATSDATLNNTLPVTGRFTVLVSDDNGRETGNYQLSLN